MNGSVEASGSRNNNESIYNEVIRRVKPSKQKAPLERGHVRIKRKENS